MPYSLHAMLPLLANKDEYMMSDQPNVGI